jgi:predicted O-methyltransferase YrrM
MKQSDEEKQKQHKVRVTQKGETVLREIEKKANREFLPIMGREKGQVLAEAVRKSKPKRVLEVGTLIGYSAIVIGKELDDNAKVITMEIHADEAEAAEKNIQKAAIPLKIEVIKGDAIQVIPELEGSFDFAFIDAEKTQYLDYLRLAEDKLRNGAVIVADNVGIFASQMKNYLDYVRTSRKYCSKYVPVGADGFEISVKT